MIPREDSIHLQQSPQELESTQHYIQGARRRVRPRRARGALPQHGHVSVGLRRLHGQETMIDQRLCRRSSIGPTPSCSNKTTFIDMWTSAKGAKGGQADGGNCHKVFALLFFFKNHLYFFMLPS